MTITDLYPFFIIVGISIIAATSWMLRQYRMQMQNNQELIQLNEQLGYDLPDFLRQCWPLLNKCGFHGMTWHLDWFGTEVTGQAGKDTGEEIDKSFQVQEVSLRIRLYSEKKGWEQRFFINAQAENFMLLVRMNLWTKMGSVQGAFDQAAKMTVFLRHDVKNMVQLLSFTAEQLQDTNPSQEQKLLGSLREAIPAVRDRAEHMLRSLNDKPARQPNQKSAHENQPVALARILRQTATVYDLPISINGDAEISMDKDILHSIFDNLLGNYSRLSHKSSSDSDLQVTIHKHTGDCLVTIEDRQGKPFLKPERLFEPFWSEHGSGRGIGLYQARQQALAAGGRLAAEAAPDKPLKFCLTLPA